DGEARIGGRLVAGAGKNHKFIFDDLVNAHPAIIARCADHLHQLLHPFSCAAARQRECPDLLQLLARCLFHSAEKAILKKPRAVAISTREILRAQAFNACSRMMSATPGSVPMDEA